LKITQKTRRDLPKYPKIGPKTTRPLLSKDPKHQDWKSLHPNPSTNTLARSGPGTDFTVFIKDYKTMTNTIYNERMNELSPNLQEIQQLLLFSPV
jgi:hypothetical protein